MIFGFSFLGLLVVLAALLAASIRILREYERGVVFTLGRFWKVKGPGLVLLVPAVQQMVKIDLRTIVFAVPTQDVISRDNVSVKVSAVVYLRVIDPERAIIQVENYLNATSQLAQTTLRSVLGKHELDDMLAGREKLNLDIQQALDAQTNSWGIKVTNVEIKQVDLTESMIRAIARQAEAERERRAKVIHAEGELQASEKLFQAARVLAQEPQAIQLRYLETLTVIGADKNTTVIFPLPMDLIAPFLPKPKARARRLASCTPTSPRSKVPRSLRLRNTAAEIRGAHFVVRPQLARLARDGQASGLEHVAAVGDRKRHACVLLDQQHGRAAAPDLADDGKHLLHDHRRKPQRRLVEQQQPGFGHQAPRHGHHLLLATREGPAERVGERANVGEEVEHLVRLGDQRGLGDAPSVRCAEHDVLARRKTRKEASALRHVGNAEAHDGLGRQSGDRAAIERHLAGHGLQQTRDSAQRRRLAGAVATQQRHHLAGVDGQREAVQGLDLAVADGQAVKREQGHRVRFQGRRR